MNLFELFVKIGAKDEASGTISKITQGLGKGLKTAAKIGTAAVGAAAAGITALTTAAVNNYAEYEQLAGGVETLFKQSSDTVMGYAENAYKTAGLSANEYMSTVTSFSASLLQSLGGDTEAAAKYADMAITDMSDNANKMGTSMEMIQNAYQGFAKQNYTMLDNLKLGYGGTKEEMARLIKDASKLDKSIKANDMSFGNIVKAINAVQTEMGITGTTAKEAASTIQGSVGMMKSSWANLVTGIADENANLDILLTNFIDSVGTVAENLIPKIEVALGSISSLIEKLAPVIVEALPSLVSSVVPSLISAATDMVNSVIKVLPDLLNTIVDALVDNAPSLITAAIELVQSLIQGIQDNYQILVDGAIQIVTQLANGILNMLPQIVALGLDLIVSLANGIAESLPELIPTIIDVVLQIVDTLTNPETLSSLVDASIAIIIALADGLINALPTLLEQAPVIISNLVTSIVQNVPKLLEAAASIITQLVTGIVNLLPKIGEAAGKIVTTVVNGVKNLTSKIKEVGKNIVAGVWNGISEKITWFTSKVKGFFTGIVNSVKSALGIASPSKVFASIGGFMADGLGEGWEKEYKNVKNGILDNLDFGVGTVDFAASSSGQLSKKLQQMIYMNTDQNIGLNVFLDGKEISKSVTKHQRNAERAYA